MRRAGKTALLHQLRREWMERGIARERLPYSDLEIAQLFGVPAAHILNCR
jgi:hypothetical protein